MQEWKIGECILRAKNNDVDAIEFIIAKMEPLLKKYVKKLFFMERDDAYQELVLALFEGIIHIPDCSSDSGCLLYLQNTVIHKFCFLCKKNMKKQEYETSICNESLELLSINDQTAEIVNNLLLQKLLHDLSNQERLIMGIIIVQGVSDAECARRLGVSRQYIYKVKKRVCNEWKSLLS